MRTTDDLLIKRLDLRLAQSDVDTLKNIRRITKAVSDAEVVRNALKAYESLLNKRKV